MSRFEEVLPSKEFGTHLASHAHLAADTFSSRHGVSPSPKLPIINTLHTYSGWSISYFYQNYIVHVGIRAL
jgi:hypothetical protein